MANMIVKPSVEDLMKKMDSRYTLVVTVSKRARQIVDGAALLVKTKSTKPVTIAISEVDQGKVWYVRNAEESSDEIKARAGILYGIPRGIPGVIDIDQEQEHSGVSELKKAHHKSDDSDYKRSKGKASGSIARKLRSSEVEEDISVDNEPDAIIDEENVIVEDDDDLIDIVSLDDEAFVDDDDSDDFQLSDEAGAGREE